MTPLQRTAFTVCYTHELADTSPRGTLATVGGGHFWFDQPPCVIDAREILEPRVPPFPTPSAPIESSHPSRASPDGYKMPRPQRWTSANRTRPPSHTHTRTHSQWVPRRPPSKVPNPHRCPQPDRRRSLSPST